MKRVFGRNSSNRRNSSTSSNNKKETSSTTVRTVSLQTGSTNRSLKTHIEVCARIRPLVIASSEGVGFFHNPTLAASSRKGKVRRPVASRLGGWNNSSATRKSSDPLSKQTKETKVAWDVSADGDTVGQASHISATVGRTQSYTLDKIYATSSSTAKVYQESVQSLVVRAMEGYHTSVLAYGQSGTGKTFTMSGTKSTPGLIPLCIQDCFHYVKSPPLSAAESETDREYLFRLSYLEVYKEHIRDLLADTPEPIRLFEQSGSGGAAAGLVIKGLKEEVVSSPEQIYRILEQGEARRQVGATHMNQHSSRSHVMVRLWIESSTAADNDTTNSGARVSSLSLVDLAGSESVRLNQGERREEGKYINQSLMTLGQIVLSLSEGKPRAHVPYRDSKLTRLLQPSLSGNAQMLLLCCISPLASHMDESHNTFKFATRAKKVEQKAIVNHVETDDPTLLLQNYRDEIADLKEQLADAKAAQQRLASQQQSTPTPMAAITSPPNTSDRMAMDTTEGEIRELMDAIQTMERLIVTKSRSNDDDFHMGTGDSSSNDDDFLNGILGDSNRHESNKEGLKTPVKEDPLRQELARVRGLLGSVLQKKHNHQQMGSPAARTDSLATSITSPSGVKRLFGFGGTPQKAADDDDQQEEMDTLRQQLEEQQMATNLRKADSSFLQSQLQEKDTLLEEVSKVLEAMEQRQGILELENEVLRAELQEMKKKHEDDIINC